MKKIVSFAVVSILLGSISQAQVDERKALAEISAEKISSDLKEAMAEHNSNGQFAVEFDYTVCLSEASSTCHRFIAYNSQSEDANAYESIALTYGATKNQDGAVDVSVAWDWQNFHMKVANYQFSLVEAALKHLEQDYLGEGPVRTPLAAHPFQVEVILLSSNSELNLGDDTSTSDTKYLVLFTEGGYSRVVGWTTPYAYIVREQATDEKTEITVKKLDVNAL